ncbi:MAG: RpiB/LacA/LacB family sugar-phosphate isomerase [Pirellulales bacterium]
MANRQTFDQPPIDVEVIVREVMARLETSGDGDQATTGTQDGRGTKGQKAAGSGSSGELALTARVVSLAELDGRLEGLKRLRVPAGAVLTPAVRDLLRQGNVAVEYVGGSADTARHTLVLGLAESAYEPAALARAVAQTGTSVEQLARTGLAGVVSEMCDLVASGGKLGLLLCGQPAAALCLANRRPGVRAAVAADRRGVTGALDQVAANLLVVQPASRSFSELRQMMIEFVRPGPRSCPEHLRSCLS